MLVEKVMDQLKKRLRTRAEKEAQLPDNVIHEMYELKLEINKALKERKNAERYFHHVVGNDAVEFAILRQMAAEQEYRMLLNKARAMKVDWSAVRGGSA